MDKKQGYSKIGCVIAYISGHNNYGTSLQGHAMLRKLQDMGYDVEVIYYKKRLTLPQKIRFVWNAVRAGGAKTIKKRIQSKLPQKLPSTYLEGIKERTHAVNGYKERKLLPLFKIYVGYQNLHAGSKNYDAVIVGSDQVWAPLSLANKYFNLLFVDDSVRKVSYASSFGVSVVPSFQRKATGRFLDRFYRIGVREQRGKEIVEELSQNNATVVADPTLLLNRKEWEDEISESNVKESEPYIFCYFLGPNREARLAALELKKQTGLKIVTIRHMDEFVPEDEGFGDSAPYNIGPNDFVKLISNASYVCTDSFHCSVFSIIFHRKFMTFYRFANTSKTGRNSRIDSLFRLLGISRDHIFDGDISRIESPIAYESVDAKIETLRKESIDFIMESLS